MAARIQLSPPAGIQPGTRVILGEGSRAELAARIDELLPGRPRFIVGDARVAELWRGDIGLDDAAGWLEIPSGEDAKTPEVLARICRELCRAGLTRDGCVVAVGGGATGDVVGLAASLYLRGVPVVQVPTTLLAMVDAGLGGKCAVNLPEGKNLFGAFWAPVLMVADTDFLSTLPEVELLSGIGEVAKYAIGFSADLLGKLEAERPAGAIPDIVEACLRIKAAIVEDDPFEREGGSRVRLNLGHTGAHALESWATATGTHVPHGLAVGWGLRVACRTAVAQGWMTDPEQARADALLDRLGLPRAAGDLVAEPPSVEELMEFAGRDKKRTSRELRVVLPRGLGSCALATVRAADLLAGLR